MEALSARIGRRVRREREARQWSLGHLAELSRVSKASLSNLENGSGNPSIETLWRISQALQLPLGTLLAEPEQPRARLIRERSGDPVSAEAGMTAWPLHAEGRPHRSEVYDNELPKGIDQRSEAHLPRTEELIYCLAGRLLVGPFGEEVEIGRGDAVWFRADVPHHYVALEDSRALCVMLYLGGGA